MALKQPSPARPKAATESLTPENIDELKGMLIRKREELSGQIATLKYDAVAGSDSTNWEEDGTDAFDREFAFKMAGSRNEMLNAIDQALRQIDEGTYGTCAECNAKIGRARMQVLPFCHTCIDCQAKAEHGPGARRRS